MQHTQQAIKTIQKTLGPQRIRRGTPARSAQADQTNYALLQQAAVNPASVPPSTILTLQRWAGNQAVTGLIQTKLTVGPPGDRYEQEADRVAEQVVSYQPSAVSGRRSGGGLPGVRRQEMPEEEEVQMQPLAATITPLVQRQAPDEDRLGAFMETRAEKREAQQRERQKDIEEYLQPKPLVQRQEEEEEEIQAQPLVQRQEEEEEEIQAQPLIQRQEEEEEEIQTKSHARVPAPPAPDLERRLAAQKGGGRPLPAETRAFMEPRFGVDFSGVRVHTGGAAVQLARDLKAQAFTHGQDIYFGSGRYNPDTAGGKRLLAHELTHVIQQKGKTELQRQGPAVHLSQVGPRVQRYTTASLQQPGPVNWQGETRSVTRPGEGASGGIFFFRSDEEVVVKPEKHASPARVYALEKTLQAADVPVAATMRIVPADGSEGSEIKQTVRSKLKLSPDQEPPGIAGIPKEKQQEMEEILNESRDFFVQPKVSGVSLASLLSKADTVGKMNSVIAKLSSPKLLKQLGRMMVVDLAMGMTDRVNAFAGNEGKVNLGNVMISGEEQASLIAIDNEATLNKLGQGQSPLQSDWALDDVRKLRQNPDTMINYFFQMIEKDYLSKLPTESFNPVEYFRLNFERNTARDHIIAGMDEGVAALARLVTDKNRRGEIKEAMAGPEGASASWETFRARGAWLAAHAKGATFEEATAQATQYLQVRRAYKEWKAYVESLFEIDPEVKTVPSKPRGLMKKLFKAQVETYDGAQMAFSEAVLRHAAGMQALQAQIGVLLPLTTGSDLEAQKARRKLEYIQRKANIKEKSARLIQELKGVLAQWMGAEQNEGRRRNLLKPFTILEQSQQALVDKTTPSARGVLIGGHR